MKQRKSILFFSAEGAPNPDVFAGDVEPNAKAPVVPNELGLGIAGDPKGAPAVPPQKLNPNKF